MEDLAKLPSIDASVVLGTLKERHQSDLIYTKNGAVLIAINPYKDVGVSQERHLQLYKSSMALENEPPHIFCVSAAAHRARSFAASRARPAWPAQASSAFSPKEEDAESQDSGWRSSWPTWGTDILPHPSWLIIASIGPYLGHLERHHP